MEIWESEKIVRDQVYLSKVYLLSQRGEQVLHLLCTYLGTLGVW